MGHAKYMADGRQSVSSLEAVRRGELLRHMEPARAPVEQSHAREGNVPVVRAGVASQKGLGRALRGLPRHDILLLQNITLEDSAEAQGLARVSRDSSIATIILPTRTELRVRVSLREFAPWVKEWSLQSAPGPLPRGKVTFEKDQSVRRLSARSVEVVVARDTKVRFSEGLFATECSLSVMEGGELELGGDSSVRYSGFLLEDGASLRAKGIRTLLSECSIIGEGPPGSQEECALRQSGGGSLVVDACDVEAVAFRKDGCGSTSIRDSAVSLLSFCETANSGRLCVTGGKLCCDTDLLVAKNASLACYDASVEAEGCLVVEEGSRAVFQNCDVDFATEERGDVVFALCSGDKVNSKDDLLLKAERADG